MYLYVIYIYIYIYFSLLTFCEENFFSRLFNGHAFDLFKSLLIFAKIVVEGDY